jgi:hypothetical protein
MEDEQEIMQALRQFIAQSSPEDVRDAFRPGGDALDFVVLLRPQNYNQIMFEKNMKIFGNVNAYLDDFLPAILQHLQTVQFPKKEGIRRAARPILERMLNTEGLTAQNRQRIQDALGGPLRSETTAPAAGKRRRKTRRA